MPTVLDVLVRVQRELIIVFAVLWFHVGAGEGAGTLSGKGGWGMATEIIF